MSTPTSSAAAAVMTGAVTALYYATPDLISSRTARGWVKAALTGISVAQSVPEIRSAWVTVRREVGGALATAYDGLPAQGRAAVLGCGAAALGAAAGGVLAAERWAFRHGRARAAAGRRLPHTGPALLYGALAAGLRLLPPPSFDSGQPAAGTP